MRTTHALILRLLVDTDEPGALRGVLRPVGDPGEHPFTDESSLLALLRQADRLFRPAGQIPADSPQCDGSATVATVKP